MSCFEPVICGGYLQVGWGAGHSSPHSVTGAAQKRRSLQHGADIKHAARGLGARYLLLLSPPKHWSPSKTVPEPHVVPPDSAGPPREYWGSTALTVHLLNTIQVTLSHHP
ncbi:hypothetical protein Bbelb_442570, partial [Branchiostoma belcheri]